MSSQKLQAVLAKLTGVKQAGTDQYMAMCPCHDDTNASLAVAAGKNGGVVMHCHGCGAGPSKILPAIGLTMHDVMPDGHKSMRPEDMPDKGLTLDELARAKQLPLDFLKSLGCRTVTNEKQRDDGSTFSWLEVLIPYFNADGTFAARHRRRFALTGDRRFAWTGTKAAGAIIPYGLHRLAAARTAGELVVVEGESDCWTLWHHGYAAIGFPGASMVGKLLKAEQLEGIGKIFVFREPDRGGQQFAAALLSRLKKLTWSGFAWVVSIPDVKDPSVLHLQNAAAFRPAFDAALKAAAPLGSESLSMPGRRAHTDLGNAERLNDAYGPDLRYCFEMGRWLVWDGQRWNANIPEGVYSRTYDVIRKISKEAEGLPAEQAKAIMDHAVRSERAQRIEAAIVLARSMVPVKHEVLDGDSWLLNCLNGMIDLRTGHLIPHDPAKYITKLVRANYDPNAECPRWLSFINRIMDGNADLIGFLQRMTGYCLTGSTGEECMAILYGTGRNGKGKFLSTLQELLGDYAQTCPTATLMDKGQSQTAVSNDVARLRGARLVTASETEDGQRLNESQIKQLTGGDTVSARFLHHEFFDFVPVCKFLFACNHKPRIKGTDEGIWSRIRLIPFRVFIPPEERDKHLMDKLRVELPGVLAWAVRGCLDWQKLGLGDTVQDVTECYRNEMDVIGEWLADCVVEGQQFTISAKQVVQAYTQWCERQGEHPIGARRLTSLLLERGFEHERGTGNAYYWTGLGIRSNMNGEIDVNASETKRYDEYFQ